MQPIRGKFYILHWSDLGADGKIVRNDFKTEQEAQSWVIKQSQYNMDDLGVRYCGTVEEELAVLTERKLKYWIAQDYKQVLEWLEQVPEAHEFIDRILGGAEIERQKARPQLEANPYQTAQTV